MSPEKKRKKQLTKDLVLENILTLVERGGWHSLTLFQIAESLDISERELFSFFPSKFHVLTGIIDQVNALTLKSVATTDVSSLSPVDRLFEVLMARFESAMPYKKALHSLWQDHVTHPSLMLSHLPLGLSATLWILETAKVYSPGLSGLLQINAFSLLHLKLLNTWFTDQSEDMSKTMTEIDKSSKVYIDFFWKNTGCNL